MNVKFVYVSINAKSRLPCQRHCLWQRPPQLAGKRGPLSESRAVAEPWTEAGASWGTSDGDRIVMAGAWEMARLCSTKVRGASVFSYGTRIRVLSKFWDEKNNQIVK